MWYQGGAELGPMTPRRRCNDCQADAGFIQTALYFFTQIGHALAADDFSPTGSSNG